MPKLVIPEPTPPAVQALLDQRRRAGADRHDEIWGGVLHMAPAPGDVHAVVAQQLAELLGPVARAAGLTASVEFNLGAPDDYRVPDGGLHRDGRWGTYAASAALVVEIVSPGDETWEKLVFYAAHAVDELLIVDPAARAVHWLTLAAGEYQPCHRSRLVELGAEELAGLIDWPA